LQILFAHFLYLDSVGFYGIALEWKGSAVLVRFASRFTGVAAPAILDGFRIVLDFDLLFLWIFPSWNAADENPGLARKKPAHEGKVALQGRGTPKGSNGRVWTLGCAPDTRSGAVMFFELLLLDGLEDRPSSSLGSLCVGTRG
jgi:hypothetical protein